MLRTTLLRGRLASKYNPLYRSFHINAAKLIGKQPFDEAEIYASKLNNGEYKSKRTAADFQWPERSEQQSREDAEDRMDKMMKVTAMFQGLLIVAGIGATATLAMQWSQVQSWWLEEGVEEGKISFEKLKEKKLKKKLLDIPFVPDTELGPEIPGLYYFGGDSKNSLFPRRNAGFNNKKLRDVSLGENSNNLAIDEHGDLLQWGNKGFEVLLQDQNLVTVKQSNGCAYALNKKGKLLIIPLDDAELRSKYINFKRSWVLPWKKYCYYNWKIDTNDSFHGKGENKIVQFDTGKEHLVLISNIGKAYTCSTGVTPADDSKSNGQFGVPTLSQFDYFPKCNKLHEIELLNNSLDDKDTVFKRKIEQVACGGYHTLARDSNGNLFSFGLNTFGQLGLPISYEMEKIPYPKTVGGFQSYFTRDEFVKCVDIQCGGDTSYVTMQSQSMQDYYKGKKMRTDSKISYFSFGNGQCGQLGNGSFRNSQPTPTKIKAINADELGASTFSKVKKWSCGGEHVVCELENGDILTWGGNDNGQLGTGKRFKQCKPQCIPELLRPGVKNTIESISTTQLILNAEQTIATGPNSSCIYWQK